MRRLLLFVISFLCLIPLCSAQTQGEDPDVIEFAFITDTHNWGPSADIRFADNNIKAFVQYCNDHPSIKFALHGGDFMNAYDTRHEQALFCLEHGMREFAGLRVPLYTTKGNHDCNGKQRTEGKRDNTQIVTDHEYYKIFSPLSPDNPLCDSTGIVTDPERPEGNYYYRDFPRQKFRLIVLNDYDIDSLEYFGYHGPQMKWLATRALDFTQQPDPSDWCFLILGHGFGFNMFAKPISRLLHAYTQGQDFEDQDRGYSYHCQFDKQPRAQLVALLGGHNHEDLYDCPDGYNIIHANRGFATGGEVGVPEYELCFDHFILNTRTHTLEARRVGRGRDHLYSYSPGQQLYPQATFPETMGMGGLTHGGANGRAIWVTNLNDSGPGSLRWAVSQQGNRMICFKVSGTIQLKSPLLIANDSISICGHSAPGEGIALQGQSVQILASEVIVRYLHLRNCELSDGDFGQHDIILDHLSASFSEGTAIAIRRAQNVTVQNCLISHTRSIGLEAGGYMSTYYRNVIANCPNAIHIPDHEGENRWIHIFRNVIDNWQDYAMYGGGSSGEVTIEENYLIPGPATRNTQMLTASADGTGRYYTNNNSYYGRERIYDQWGLVDDHIGLPYDPTDDEVDYLLRERMNPVARPSRGRFDATSLVIAAFHYRGLFTRPTRYQTWREAMLTAGCSLSRDSYDQALIASLRSHTPMGTADGLLSTISSLGGYPRIRRQTHDPHPSVLKDWLDRRTDAVNDRSIIVLFDDNTHGRHDIYPLIAGHHDALISDTCHVSIVSAGNFLATDGSEADNTLAARLMAETGYDAIVLGTTELQRTLGQLQQELKPIQHCVTSATLIDEKDGGTRIFSPYVMKQFGRRQVAFIGVSNPRRGMSRADFVQNVQQSINHARREGAGYVILLSHLDPGQSPVDAATLIAALRDVDAVIDGTPADEVPARTLSDADSHDVLYTSTGTTGRAIGMLIIAPDDMITSELIPISNLRFKSRRITQLFD